MHDYNFQYSLVDDKCEVQGGDVEPTPPSFPKAQVVSISDPVNAEEIVHSQNFQHSLVQDEGGGLQGGDVETTPPPTTLPDGTDRVDKRN